MIDPEEIPRWVPAAVRAVAPVVELGAEDVRRRLLTDQRMNEVWDYLLRRAPVDFRPVTAAALDTVPSSRMTNWGVDDYEFSFQEQGCAALYICVLRAIAVPVPARTFKEVQAMIVPWREAANQCRLAISSDVTLGLKPEVSKALAISASYFDDLAHFVEGVNTKDNPHVLLGRKGSSEDDNIRGVVRSLALETKIIFGSFLLGTLASVASVALQIDVTKKDVQNWCQGLPSAN